MDMRNSFYILLNILFITFASYLGVNAFYKVSVSRFVPLQPSFFPENTEGEHDSGMGTKLPLSHYRSISERDLFKTVREIPDKPDTEKKPEIAELRETELKIRLYGTVTGEESYAVIQDVKKRKQRLYAAGDTVLNAKIQKILRNKVILDVDGKSEVLKLEKRSSGRGKTYSPVQKVSSPSNVRKRNIRISRSKIDNAMSNINDLMKQAKIRPHFRNGQPDGLTLSRIRRDSIFRNLGLQSGDIIMGVNGDEIRSVDDALNFYNSLRSASDVSLRIKRRGRLQELSYSIQ